MMPMINQPDTQEQKSQSEKLVLPAPPAEEQQMYYGGQMAQLRPEQLIRRQSPPAPTGVKARLAFYWHKDPAYKVLMIALTLVLVAGIIFVSLASAAFLGNSNFFASSYTPQAVPKGVNPTGTVNLRPTFPTPGGGIGTNQQSSQPSLRPTPALQATNPTVQQSPTPTSVGGGTLSVQFTSIPQQVMNGSYVSVGVNTSEPGASVILVIRYSIQGSRSTAGPQTTDSNGNATISWFVLTYGFGQKNVQAYVYALATDQNGQSARSPTVTVQVLTRGGG
jgi:hypothetical protein